ncbi:MAG: OmpA family protein [Bacteroidales bacterium]|nr:OmpA family protein [Bacteroidales bacterium]
MKRALLIISILCFFRMMSLAQIDLNKVVNHSAKKAERNVENRIERRIDKGVDKTLDKTEEDIDNAVNDDGKDEKRNENNHESIDNKKAANESGKNNSGEKANSQDPQKQAPVLTWARYDFVPGTEIIFEDNLENELNGEFPSKWDLKSGSIENAALDGQKVIYFMKCNINGGGGIVPMLKNSTSDYLPEQFTVEFDAFFEEKSSSYSLFLVDNKNQQKLDNSFPAADKWIRFHKNGAEYKQDISTKYYPGFSSKEIDNTAKWRHIAVSFNTRAMKVYLDDARILNIPNLGYNPTGITIGYHNPGSASTGYIKNIRIAKGAVPLYDKFLTDGKFITTGIRFDVNKASIRPESMGTINYVVKMMEDHPELKFSVEGHTDSDGDDAFNMKLSKARALAVVEIIVKLGIATDRLTSEGLGENKPMAGNDTPEGKALNRRVEFVKF